MLLQTRAHHARIGAAYGRGSLRARAAAATSSGRRSGTGPSCVVCLAERRQGGSGSVVVNEGATILVAGATGGVGQILTKKLVDRGFTVKALSRSKEKSVEVLGTASNLEHLEGDIIEKHTLASVLEDVSAVCCCTGTTAFPTLRWLGNNDPEKNSYVGTKNLVEVAVEEGKKRGKDLSRFVFVSSAGVKRYDQGPPYSILNAFGVLVAKEKAEDFIMASGIPYTIVRPGRLTDAPYTSYDLNTLIKGESGTRKEVNLSLDEELDGETSRAAVAESCLQSLLHDFMADTVFSIESIVGEGPDTDKTEWIKRFQTLNA